MANQVSDLIFVVVRERLGDLDLAASIARRAFIVGIGGDWLI